MREGPIAIHEHFSVIEETEDWIVVDKGAPLIVHPANNLDIEPTLLGGVENLLAYELVNGVKLSIINRLDRETSGIVVLAKNKSMARLMGKAMERRLVSKGYLALAFGWPEWNEISVDQPLLRAGEVMESPIWVKQAVHQLGRESVTRFIVEDRREVNGVKISKLRVKPHTGRMHQIRVHAGFLGFPLVGDKIYGSSHDHYLNFIEGGWTSQMSEQIILPRHALHSNYFSMELDGEVVGWQSPLADDLERFWNMG